MHLSHSKLHAVLALLLHLCCLGTTHTAKPCFPADAAALLQLKRSFLDATNLTTWQAGTDCCRWEAVVCDAASRRVIALDLGERNVQSRGLDPALFNLTALRNLSLSGADFMGARLPSVGFELLTEMVHLDFSSTGFMGQIPIGIARLRELVTLSFSSNGYGASQLFLKEPSFQTFVANLSNLRELSLHGVDVSSSRETWSIALANSTHRLQYLDLSNCGLSGSIHQSFSRLHSLVDIKLGFNEIAGKVPEFFADFPLLSSLHLSGNDFEGEFPTKILLSKSLRGLSLTGNSKLSGHIPSFSVGSKLELLQLLGTNFSDAIPVTIVNLKSLRWFSLTTEGTSKHLSLLGKLPSLDALVLRGSSGLRKPIFSWIGDLNHLKHLYMISYNFSEPIPSWISNLTNLKSLFLYDDNFYGLIPPWISNLTQLSDMDFTGNYLTGKIPRSLFTLPELESLSLRSNELSGHLDDIDDPLSSSLYYLDLENNNLDGSISESYLHLPNIEFLYLGSNKLSGIVELSSFWRLKKLTYLDLSNNMLTVIDHHEDDSLSTSLPKISYLRLASCNLKQIPGTLKFLHEIDQLDLSSNRIHGVIPSWLWEKWNCGMTYLNLSHNIFTSLEKFSSIMPVDYTYTLDLSSNILEGNIPIVPTAKEINELMIPGETILDYSNNSFTSVSPNFGKYLRETTFLDLSKNKLNGDIPPSICSARRLEILDLSYNNFGGMIPSCLIQDNLRILKFRGNQIHGMLPDSIGEAFMLQTLDLSTNYITGKLPRSLSNCRDLELLDISNNRITDSFPSWLGVLPKLKVLVLRSNQFFGMITDLGENCQIISNFSSLQILDLASNSFTGHLPQEWLIELKSMMANNNDDGQIVGHQTNMSQGFYRDTVTITFKGFDIIFTKILTTFKVIDLSNNSFDGPIPESVGRLSSLHGLNISYNNFTKQIPSQLGNLTRLESLDLSWNHLSGEIPQELTSLTSLAWLNLSYNNLTGRIPQGNQFFSFPNNSFEGNPGLCGSQVSKQCDNPGSTTPRASDHPASNILWQDRTDAILLFTFVGLGFGVGFALAIMFLHFCRIDGWNRKCFCIRM